MTVHARLRHHTSVKPAWAAFAFVLFAIYWAIALLVSLAPGL